MEPFAIDLDDEQIRRERRKARELRDSQWWKRRLAKGLCYWCGRATSPKALTMDHIVPLSRGGKTTKSNVVPACKQCNSNKKHLLPMEWEHYIKDIRKENLPEENKEKGKSLVP